jgi:hypothetical protein
VRSILGIDQLRRDADAATAFANAAFEHVSYAKFFGSNSVVDWALQRPM